MGVGVGWGGVPKENVPPEPTEPALGLLLLGTGVARFGTVLLEADVFEAVVALVDEDQFEDEALQAEELPLLVRSPAGVFTEPFR